MIRKLIRKEYYDKDFPLNEQEFKGVHFEINFLNFFPKFHRVQLCSNRSLLEN